MHVFHSSHVLFVLPVSFKLYDMDHDGYLTQAELERVMTQLVSQLRTVPISSFNTYALILTPHSLSHLLSPMKIKLTKYGNLSLGCLKMLMSMVTESW